MNNYTREQLLVLAKLTAEDTLQRLIVTQRQAAREHIYERITGLLSEPFRVALDELHGHPRLHRD